MSVFNHLDYKKFLREKISENKSVHAYKSKLAEAAGCQRSFLSQVLTGHVHLTADHAVGLAEFWGLNTRQTEHLLDLVAHARSGTKNLTRFLERRIRSRREESEDLAKRIEYQRLQEESNTFVYYSVWYYPAVHVLVAAEGYRRPSRLAERLGLPESLVTKTLEDLARLGVVELHESGWRPTKKNIHLPRDSPLNPINHWTWRQRAVQSAALPAPGDLHYTAICALSVEDARRVRELLSDFIDSSRRLIEPSREEEAFAITCDVFRV